MKHIVMYSGGAGSFMTAQRVIDKYGKEDVSLLFTDTLTEDEDLYRFINETVQYLGVEYHCISDGRDIWKVFKDTRYLGNSRTAPCTRILKQEIARKFIFDNFNPEDTILYLGIDWTEFHRTEAPKKNWEPFRVEFPLCEQPYLTKQDVFDYLQSINIEIPYLYKLGFSHNNCMGLCVKGGQGHWTQVYKTLPDRFLFAEQKEREMQEYLGKNVTILKNMSLEELRQRIESQPQTIDMFDIGGCGCFVTN